MAEGPLRMPKSPLSGGSPATLAQKARLQQLLKQQQAAIQAKRRVKRPTNDE